MKKSLTKNFAKTKLRREFFFFFFVNLLIFRAIVFQNTSGHFQFILAHFILTLFFVPVVSSTLSTAAYEKHWYKEEYVCEVG